MNKSIYCLHTDVWAHVKYNEYNNGLDAAADYLASLKREDLVELVEAIKAMKYTIDTTMLPEIPC